MKWNNANCYGYAARMNVWGHIDANYRNRDCREDVIDELIANNPDWILVEKKDMKPNKAYVAFRTSRDDFHFMYRNKAGCWRHKPGCFKVEAISQKNVFADRWQRDDGGAPYVSKIYLFEIID